jgi:hypothetical protein
VSFAPYGLVYASALVVALVAALTKGQGRPLGLFAATLLVLFAGLRGNSVDYEGYVELFDLMAQFDAGYPERFFFGKDILFGMLMDGVQRLGGGAQTMFFAAALLSVGLKQRAFAIALHGNTALAWLITLCVSFFLHEFTQIRTAIALPLCFLALQCLLAGRKRAWLGLIMLASGFHLSALIFLPVTAVLLLPPQQRALAWAVTTAAVALAIPPLFNIVGALDPRISAHADEVGLNLTAIAVGAFKLALLVVMALHAKHLPQRLHGLRQMVWPTVMFVATGLVMLVVMRGLATTVAFRLYEFFDAFAIWVVLAALLQPRPLARILAAGYCAFALMLQILPGLFIAYELAPLSSLLAF